MNNIRSIAIALAAGLVAVAGASQAAVSSGQSQTTYVTVGGTNDTTPDHPGTLGSPGIGVKAFYNGAMVSFSGLYTSPYLDGNGVASITPADMPASHAALGYFDFAKVSGQEVYFGEWSQNGNVTDGTHTVYYSGDNTGTTVPTSGTATYSIAGIGNYSGAGLLSGSLDADFAAGTLSGYVGAVDLSATINSATASFSGTAYENNAALSGSTSGNFFGANAAALAGIATFSNNQYDVAYGGSRD